MDDQAENPATPADRALRPAFARPRLPRWAPKAAFESALIVFSVLLALLLGDFFTEMERDRQAAEARRFLAEEIRSNREAVSARLPYHEELLQRILTGTGPDALQDAVLQSGLRFVQFRDSVWQGLSGNDELMRRFEPEAVFLLTDIYSRQETIDQNGRAIIQVMMEFMIDSDPADMRPGAYFLYLSEAAGAEQALLDRYEAALTMLDEG